MRGGVRRKTCVLIFLVLEMSGGCELLKVAVFSIFLSFLPDWKGSFTRTGLGVCW